MKTFEQVISIEVSVQAIADKLLSTFDANFAHREMLTEAIIGTGIENGSIAYVYNALGGYSNEIDFKIGQIVECTDTVHNYRQKPLDPNLAVEVEQIIQYESGYHPIGKAEIIDIDIYKRNKLKIKYTIIDSKGQPKETTDWVKHKSCSGIPV